MNMPLNACGVGTVARSEGVRPDQAAGPIMEWLTPIQAAVRVGRNENSVRQAAHRGLIRWRIEDGRMLVTLGDTHRWSDAARNCRRSVRDRRPAWFSHLPGPAAQADAAQLARDIVRLRDEYEDALRTMPEAALGYLLESEMLLDERARLLRQPGAGLDRSLDSLNASTRADVA